jgi:Flp pilus assembly secretin CpaC
MKTAIIALIATMVIAFTASASQALLVETTITQQHAKGGPDVLAVPSITVESGKQAAVKIGKLEYAVTPTLLDDGTVDICAILTQRDGEKSDKLAAPRIKAQLGEAAQIQIGQLTFATKTSLAK